MTRDHILAIDNGTQSVRALLFDPRGNLLAKSRVPIEPYFSTQPGYAEQNPEVFWQAVCDCLPATLADARCEQRQHRGCGADHAARHDDQPRSERPAAAARARAGSINAARRTSNRSAGLWGLAFRLSGMTPTVAYLQAEAEANWIRTLST